MNIRCSCSQRGCVETDISGEHILRRTGVRPERLNDQTSWTKYGNELGLWMLNLTCLFKLRQILLIGGVSNQHTHFLPTAQEFIRERLRLVPMPRIAVSRLNEDAGVQGAYWAGSDL
jgi:predicted NBD/HSP70 family sugar kinase